MFVEIINFRDGNDGLFDDVSYLTGLSIPSDDDKALQSGKDDADINVLMRRFSVTGQLPAPRAEAFYGDFSNVPDYQTAQNMLIDAQRAFSDLPSDVRNRFNNDPALLMNFLHDPQNLDEARKLGLANPKPADPVVSPVGDDPTPE